MSLPAQDEEATPLAPNETIIYAPEAIFQATRAAAREFHVEQWLSVLEYGLAMGIGLLHLVYNAPADSHYASDPASTMALTLISGILASFLYLPSLKWRQHCIDAAAGEFHESYLAAYKWLFATAMALLKVVCSAGVCLCVLLLFNGSLHGAKGAMDAGHVVAAATVGQVIVQAFVLWFKYMRSMRKQAVRLVRRLVDKGVGGGCLQMPCGRQQD